MVRLHPGWGAWIEIMLLNLTWSWGVVAPRMGCMD
jgi:hypothetical protein